MIRLSHGFAHQLNQVDYEEDCLTLSPRLQGMMMYFTPSRAEDTLSSTMGPDRLRSLLYSNFPRRRRKKKLLIGVSERHASGAEISVSAGSGEAVAK